MRKIAKLISFLALAATLLPSMLFFTGRMELPSAKTWMLAAALVWFISAALWMEHKISK